MTYAEARGGDRAGWEHAIALDGPIAQTNLNFSDSGAGRDETRRR
jgi:hypothetical protein